MHLKKTIIHIYFLISIGFTCYSSQEDTSAPIHVVYSHAWYETNTRTTCSVGNNIVSITPAPKIGCTEISDVITFKQKKIAKTYKGKQFPVGDDDTTFGNSYAMKFAFLGNSLSMPSYPDASLDVKESLSKAVLYTKAAEIILLNHLYERVITEKRPRIALVGPCIGASIAINCLKKLVTFDNNKNYFNATKITTADEAQAIVKAINDGCFIAISPLMRLEHHNAVALPSGLLSALTIGALTLAAYNKGGAELVSQNTQIAQLSFLSLALLTYCTVSSFTKNIYAKMIRHWILPLLSGNKYDPQHEDPIDNIILLQNTLTGPTAINFTTQDWIMNWKNDGVLQLHHTIERNNSHIMITSDKGHMEISPSFLKFLEVEFKEKTMNKNNVEDYWKKNTQPTKDEFKKRIYPRGFISKIWATNKWAISFITLCIIPILMRYSLQK